MSTVELSDRMRDESFDLYVCSKARNPIYYASSEDSKLEKAPFGIYKVVAWIFEPENDDAIEEYGERNDLARRAWAIPGGLLNIVTALVRAAVALPFMLIVSLVTWNSYYVKTEALHLFREGEFIAGRFISLVDVKEGAYLMGEALFEQHRAEVKLDKTIDNLLCLSDEAKEKNRAFRAQFKDR